ncbi:MAG: AI-2E family transporter [Nitrospirae bacterium]|nr:AI-2E family transporter [Nitrospirota bacterium]
MRTNRFYFIVMLAIVAGLGYLTFEIIRPFIAPLTWGIVMSIVFYPLYSFISKYVKWKGLASLIVLFVIVGILIGPFSYFSYLLVNEVHDVTRRMGTGNMQSLQDILQHPTVRYLVAKALEVFNLPFSEADIEQSLVNSVSGMAKELLGKIPIGLGSVFTFFIDFILMAFATFFMLRDGAAFLERSRDYMPFSEKQKERLVRQVRDIVISTVYGGVVVAIVQGIIGGIAYAGLGIRSPVLWGISTAIASFIPMLGTFTIWGVIALYLFIQVSVFKGIIMTLIGIFAMTVLDSVLRPVLIGNRTSMPAVFIFFSVLGGIGLFGVVGLVMGPLAVALFLSVLEIFRNFEGSPGA